MKTKATRSLEALAEMIVRSLPSIGCHGHAETTKRDALVYVRDDAGTCGFILVQKNGAVSGEGLGRMRDTIIEHVERVERVGLTHAQQHTRGESA